MTKFDWARAETATVTVERARVLVRQLLGQTLFHDGRGIFLDPGAATALLQHAQTEIAHALATLSATPWPGADDREAAREAAAKRKERRG